MAYRGSFAFCPATKSEIWRVLSFLTGKTSNWAPSHFCSNPEQTIVVLTNEKKKRFFCLFCAPYRVHRIGHWIEQAECVAMAEQRHFFAFTLTINLLQTVQRHTAPFNRYEDGAQHFLQFRILSFVEHFQSNCINFLFSSMIYYDWSLCRCAASFCFQFSCDFSHKSLFQPSSSFEIQLF